MRFRRTVWVAVTVMVVFGLGAVHFHERHHHHRLVALDVRPPPTVMVTTTVPPTTVTTTIVAVTPSLYSEWARVAVCEESGWVGYASYEYPDSLGITRANWYRFGGGSDVSPAAQIAVAMRLIGYYHAAIPDQHGCQRGGW